MLRIQSHKNLNQGNKSQKRTCIDLSIIRPECAECLAHRLPLLLFAVTSYAVEIQTVALALMFTLDIEKKRWWLMRER